MNSPHRQLHVTKVQLLWSTFIHLCAFVDLNICGKSKRVLGERLWILVAIKFLSISFENKIETMVQVWSATWIFFYSPWNFNRLVLRFTYKSIFHSLTFIFSCLLLKQLFLFLFECVFFPWVAVHVLFLCRVNCTFFPFC